MSMQDDSDGTSGAFAPLPPAAGSTARGASTSLSPPTATEHRDHRNLRPQDKTGGKRMGRSFVKMAKPCQPLQNCQKNSNLMKKQSNYLFCPAGRCMSLNRTQMKLQRRKKTLHSTNERLLKEAPPSAASPMGPKNSHCWEASFQGLPH